MCFIAVEFLVAYCVFRLEKIYTTHNADRTLNSFETHPDDNYSVFLVTTQPPCKIQERTQIRADFRR